MVSPAARCAAGGCPACCPPHSQRAALWPVCPQPGAPLPCVQAVHLYLLNYSSGCPPGQTLPTSPRYSNIVRNSVPLSQLCNRSHFIIVTRACINFHCYETGIDKAECLWSTFAHVHTQDTVCMLPQVKSSRSEYTLMTHSLTTPGTESPGSLLFYFAFCLIPFPIYDFHRETNPTLNSVHISSY